MKSTTNRYRPPRVQYRLDDWNKKKSNKAAAKKKNKKTTTYQ
jgi:hypothetical protein